MGEGAPHYDISAGVFRPDSGERLPGADVIPGECAADDRHGGAALEQTYIDGNWSNLSKEAGDISGPQGWELRRHLRRVRLCFQQQAFGSPGKETAVPEGAGRHQVERSGGIRLLREPGHHASSVAERRTGNDVSVPGLWTRRNHADRHEPLISPGGGERAVRGAAERGRISHGPIGV